MATAPGSGEDQGGQLVFQKSKRLQDECYIINVRDSAESACVRFCAFELESSDTYEISYSYADFDALFKEHAELANPACKEGRYEWVIDRLDLVSDNPGEARHLVLGSEPTEEDPRPVPGKPACPMRVGPRDRLSYAERVRLRQEAERLEEKRAENIAAKSERARKAFVAELQEKRKLEELKVASRRHRIDEERARRREKAELQRHVQEEKAKRYEENDKKREERIHVLEAERKERDHKYIQEIVETARARQEAKQKMLEDARQRKTKEDAVQATELAAKREAQQKLDAKREARIAERAERLKHSEHEYLEYRKQQIAQIAREKQEKEEKKKQYLREKAAQRAALLRLKHEKIEAWERTEDQRTQNNMKKENARNMLMVDHIQSLRQKYNEELAAAASRKQAALEQRRAREAKEAAVNAEESKRLQELESKRSQNISTREAAREERNQKYCEHIRDLKTSEALRVKDQRERVESAKERSREERARERQVRSEQDFAAAVVASQREENIRKRERERDLKFAQQVREAKEKEMQRTIEMEARKTQRRLQERENAEKRQEEEQQRRRQMALLDEQREAMIRQRVMERNQREKERLSGGLAGGAGTAAPVAEADSEQPREDAAPAEAAPAAIPE